MHDLSKISATAPAVAAQRESDPVVPPIEPTSRRAFFAVAAGLTAGGAAIGTFSSACAQGAADDDLAHLQTRPRTLLKGGVVLTLDRQIGDFAQADVLIEDGKIREARP